MSGYHEESWSPTGIRQLTLWVNFADVMQDTASAKRIFYIMHTQ
jgi:hypothetical protein